MHFPASQVLNDEEEQQPDALKPRNEDIGHDRSGTPIKILPLHHVYSATSPCSGSTNVLSKKIKAQKFPMIDYVEEEDFKGKNQVSHPPVIKVYSRRSKKHGKTSVFTVENLEEESKKRVKVEPVDDGSNALGDNVVGFQSKRKRIRSSEFAKLGARPNVVYNSVVGPRLRELRNHHNHTVEKHSNSRRPRKHGKTSVFNSMVENLEQGSKKRVKVEPVDEGPNAPCDNAVGFQGKRRRIGSSELVKLGVRPNVVHNSVVGPRLREPRNHHNHIVDKNSNSRRPKKHGKTSLCDSMVENLKEGLKKTVKVEPVDKGSNALGDNAVGFQSTRRRIGNSELVKLGVRPNVVHNSVVGPRLREPRKHHNHIVDKNSNSRRPKKHGKTSACDSMVENLEEGLKKRVKVELAAEGSNALGDNAIGFQCKRRRIGSSELVKLGVRPNVVHNSVVGPRLREPRNHHNHIVDKDSNSGKLKRVKPNSSVNNKKQDQLRVKKWVRLAFDGMDPMLFIGLKCMVYWPLDDDWYEGSIVGYDAESNQHNVKYDDEEEEDLIISQEKIKFYVSRDEMLKLNLCQSNSGMECDDLDYSELLVLAASLDGSRELEPGDIIWAKVTGHAMWPAVIVDELHVGDRKGLNKNSGGRSLPVQFFGTHDFARIQVKQIVSFSRGLVSSFHLKSKSLRFIRSLREAKIYLNEQKLPKSMLHLQCGSTGASQENHSDEDGQSIDSDDACTRDGRMHQDSIDLRTSTLTIGDLQIVSLGEIVKDSDYFQDGRTVWPAGYTAIRMFTSIRDPSASVAYKMEVLRDSKSKIRPLFRVTMESGEQFKGPSPEACWEKLFKRLRKIQIDCLTPEDGAEITHVSGSEMFGFTNPEVLKLIQDLSNSGVSRKSSVRKSLSKRRQSMPDSYRAVNINWKDLDRCSVCHMDEEYETNLFLQCDECRMMVHARCYGEESVDGLLWLCKICRIGSPKSIPPCSLCPVVGGAMKPTTDGQWAHLACAMWIPETCLSDIKRMEPIDGLSRISKDRWKLLCSICGVSYGACIQCSNSTCRVAYHPLCARAAGLCVELEDEDRLHLMPVDDDEEEQCIRLLSFCKRHKPPSREHANLHVRRRQNACQPSSYIPPSNPSGCARTEPYDYFGRRGRKEPDALAAASVKRSFLENRPYVVGGYCRHERLVHISSEDDVLMGSKFSFMLQENRSSAPHSPQCASMADKYKYMRETFRQRLTFGKSRIHGFGIFAKQFHRAGDMVIEYTGELVRPSVADRREHLIYNSLVGPGTYMFRVDDERVIDATREGSIAHLINHSCEPNCYSRVITVNGDQHIIIFAKRDIKQWEELTYDYRFFSIDECLPCYCGFPRCRGVVNDTEAEEQAKLYVPSCQLRQDE